jgi:hypothetical protein
MGLRKKKNEPPPLPDPVLTAVRDLDETLKSFIAAHREAAAAVPVVDPAKLLDWLQFVNAKFEALDKLDPRMLTEEIRRLRTDVIELQEILKQPEEFSFRIVRKKRPKTKTCSEGYGE